VYTLGKSGKPEHLLLNEEQLLNASARYYKINRGGDITYHGPGQLVMYPILDLEQFFTDIHKYLRYLEEVVILTLAHFGIVADRYEGLTGVWIDPNTEMARKICAMGVKCSRWITMHGIGFNVNSDLSYFSNIIPCGIDDKAVTSMEKELGKKIPMDEVKHELRNQMEVVFGFKSIKE
jgi:lipoyl(octanoyl) transferase